MFSAVFPIFCSFPLYQISGLHFSKNTLDILTRYWFEYGRPSVFLFPNRDDPSRPMASYTASQFISAKEAELGIIQVLHTWNQELDYHVHMHCIVSGGAGSPVMEISVDPPVNS